jgi:hypothetical protein
VERLSERVPDARRSGAVKGVGAITPAQGRIPGGDGELRQLGIELFLDHPFRCRAKFLEGG